MSDPPPSPSPSSPSLSAAFRVKHHRRLAVIRAMIEDEETPTMRPLPLETIEAPSFRTSSLALRIVHQLIRPTLRQGFYELRPSPHTPTLADALIQTVVNCGIWIRREEAEAMLAEAVATGLWERDGDTVVIYASCGTDPRGE